MVPVDRMRATTLLLSLAGLLMATAIFAQDAWVKKDFTHWNSDDIKKVLTSSPWAKDVTIGTSAPNASGGEAGGSPGGRGGGGGGEDGGDSGGGGGRRGGGGGGGGSFTANSVKLVISWRTALPVKQALVKSKMGNSLELPADGKSFLEKVDDQYVVMIEGLPSRYAQAAERDKEKLAESVLRVGKREIRLVNSSFNRHGDTTEIALIFPREETIKVEENEVEVVARLGQLEAKKKFRLKDMVVNGKLEL